MTKNRKQDKKIKCTETQQSSGQNLRRDKKRELKKKKTKKKVNRSSSERQLLLFSYLFKDVFVKFLSEKSAQYSDVKDFPPLRSENGPYYKLSRGDFPPKIWSRFKGKKKVDLGLLDAKVMDGLKGEMLDSRYS